MIKSRVWEIFGKVLIFVGVVEGEEVSVGWVLVGGEWRRRRGR